ncbi:hypothetical protein PSACC_03142 [Paramicrosporidium saccamoebae]|uniref:Uncharacterized protein n=1 Tax=Paramicrosporidium saccamoebae TaxID=1246581 RepID=A0A2H9THE7_9FUNG|nr:hypothetical protein PSACC_03142 [Paramicrosporidium saccamoebae]
MIQEKCDNVYIVLAFEDRIDNLSAALKMCEGRACVVDSAKLLADFVCNVTKNEPLSDTKDTDFKKLIQIMSWQSEGLTTLQVDLLASHYSSIKELAHAARHISSQQPEPLVEALSAISQFLDQDYYVE